MTWACADCGVDTNAIAEYYMVYDYLWEWFGAEDGMLCIGCLESEPRLGRTLHKSDFTDCPLNELDNGWRKSERLIDRLTNV